ncbi:MAG: hypothetical protein EP323_00205 [Gammaproteobacteria bacterium]|nr:MAG: hypothetical protein EP323_00205 [Gammaproteobacteria bacterium]
MANLWIYLALTLTTGLWLGLVMWQKLDAFDWRYRSDDVWLGFCLGVLLWPLWLIVRPTFIFRGAILLAGDNPKSMSTGGNLAARRRQTHQIIKKPPLCGARVTYKFHDFGPSDDPVEVVFEAADIEGFFKGKELPLYWKDEQEAIIAFIKNRDMTLSDATPVPDVIDFEQMASELIDAGIGKICCVTCKMFYDTHQLTRDMSSLTPGWNFAEYRCPSDHLALRREHMHIHYRFDHG